MLGLAMMGTAVVVLAVQSFAEQDTIPAITWVTTASGESAESEPQTEPLETEADSENANRQPVFDWDKPTKAETTTKSAGSTTAPVRQTEPAQPDAAELAFPEEAEPEISYPLDLNAATAEELEFLYETYQSCGYQVILSSALKGEGLGEIEAVLKGKTTVVAGPSGVGKSSLTNSLQEEVEMETGEISRKLKRGKHTTRHAQIIPVSQDTFLVDTPGFSSLYIENMEEQELKDYFPEFRKYEGQCRFQGCRHIHEPGCAVKEALENNEISRLRYEDYLELHQELKEKRRY